MRKGSSVVHSPYYIYSVCSAVGSPQTLYTTLVCTFSVQGAEVNMMPWSYIRIGYRPPYLTIILYSTYME